MYTLLRPLLFALDAESAHHLTLESLKLSARSGLAGVCTPRVTPWPRKVMGIEFPNPVGLAAGLDKNGDYIDALATLGFGFLEIGTVTPRPQPGNPRPRMFRLPAARAVINRMGFNNHGVDALVANVRRAHFRGVLGINIGKNFDTPIERAAEDYLACLRKVYEHASYVTVNISSPNTKNLRQLQQGDELGQLLSALRDERERLTDRHGRRVPLALKIAPDLEAAQVSAIAELLVTYRIDAVIATNTTIARDAVAQQPQGRETGGLSGAPLTAQAQKITAQLAAALGDAVPVIGVGGIMCGADAAARIGAGASLVQLYTGLVYSGPALVSDCVDTIRKEHPC
ncbi:MAG: quinone-dependent dihydroorotate dehydrogenase [Burkholderiales bacterium]|nr:quinone-dependent dihydroorotate dehydrogenase [Burkholderiales bacterium]MDP2398400.1 quinone-dependent dihydroorotate dehydrogenase [Burkholderiales bacterium]